MPTSSLIIPTYNRQDIALETLNYLNLQTSKRFEVIVVDQTKNPHQNLEDFKFNDSSITYRYVKIEQIGLPNARNVAADIATTDILIYIDDDCIPEPNLVSSYINIFRQSDKIIGGWITWYGKTLKNFDTDKRGECQWAPGGNFAVRKKRFKDLGGFDINFIGNAMLEDADFGFSIMSSGGQVIYDPTPVMEHLRATSGGTRKESPSKGMYYRSHNTVYFLRKHNLRLRIFPAIFYLAAVAIKDFINRKHGPVAILWTPIGFIRGVFTKIQ